MADETDSVIYESSESDQRGGAISTVKVPNNTLANFLNHAPLSEAILGSNTYWCGYIKNDNSTTETGFIYSPTFVGTGTEFFEQVDDDTKYDLLEWGISGWFKTAGTGATQFIVAKGGVGSDTAGQNDNYSVKMNASGTISAGFEEGDGTDHYATSFLTYNDNQWHFFVAFYNGENVELYIDDMTENTDEHATTTTPETNAQPITIGRNSRVADGFWVGELDEIRIWNRPLNDLSERENLRTTNIPSTSGLILENKFGGDSLAKDSLNNVVLFINSNTISEDDIIRIGIGTAPKNGVEQIISNVNEEPTGVEWKEAQTYNQGVFIGTLRPNEFQSFWVWRELSATKEEARNRAELVIAFDPPPGSTGGGSGSGSGIPGGGGSPDPTPTVQDYSFAVTGDWSTSSDAGRTVDNILNFPEIELTISTGDNSYEDEGDEWAEITAELREDGREMKMCFGNHDAKEGTPQPELTDFYLDLMGIQSEGNRYYDFTYNNFYFIFGDCYTNFGVGSTQYNWIKDKMEKSRNNSAHTWRALLFHEPMYTSPTNYSGVSSLRNAYHPLMVANKFDFYFNGHNHNYFRSYPLNFNADSPSNPTIVAQSQDPHYSSPNAAIFCQVGSAGRSSHRSFDGTASYSAKQQDSDYGFLMISVSNSGRQVTGKFYRNSGSTQFDIFSVIK